MTGSAVLVGFGGWNSPFVAVGRRKKWNRNTAMLEEVFSEIGGISGGSSVFFDEGGSRGFGYVRFANSSKLRP